MSNTEGLTIPIHPFEKENHTMTTSIKKLMLAAFAATAICLGAKADTIDLSLLTANYTAQDGDVLTGETTKCTVSIPDGATVVLSNVTISRTWEYAPSIICLGDATIILADGTLNTLVGTLKVGGAGTALVIEGNTGELVATGNGSSAGIGAVSGTDCGNIVINGGIITANGTASSGYGGAGIGAGRSAGCGNITINGGIITATAGGTAAGIGGTGYYGSCGDIAIAATIAHVEATKGGSYGGKPLNSNYNVTIADGLVRSGDDNAITWVIEPIIKYDITWLNGDGTEIDTTIVPGNAVPTHAEPTKAAAAPYRWVFTGWSPELEAAVSNTTYTATFKKVADLSQLTGDWTAADGDEIVGETTHKVTIPGGATVTINGVEVAGAGGGGSVPAPVFAEGGASEIVKFAQAEGGKWTITAFAEMSNESRGTDVTDGQIKVFSADTLEALASATTPAAGATVKETKSAVKATVEVPAPSGKDSQFFKVKFGE